MSISPLRTLPFDEVCGSFFFTFFNTKRSVGKRRRRRSFWMLWKRSCDSDSDHPWKNPCEDNEKKKPKWQKDPFQPSSQTGMLKIHRHLTWRRKKFIPKTRRELIWLLSTPPGTSDSSYKPLEDELFTHISMFFALFILKLDKRPAENSVSWILSILHEFLIVSWHIHYRVFRKFMLIW